LSTYLLFILGFFVGDKQDYQRESINRPEGIKYFCQNFPGGFSVDKTPDIHYAGKEERNEKHN
jgi:hypothetical protein